MKKAENEQRIGIPDSSEEGVLAHVVNLDHSALDMYIEQGKDKDIRPMPKLSLTDKESKRGGRKRDRNERGGGRRGPHPSASLQGGSTMPR